MSEKSLDFLSTVPTERIISLDILRGIAVLGILIMNIQSFSMISAAYINPTAFGDLTGINKWVWIISHVLAKGKFMSIFSMLFGAGVIIFSNRAVEKGNKPGPLHYRRNFWLLVFGMLHAYLIWYGDILVAYALCGFLVYLFRNLKPSKLVIVSSVFFVIPILINLLFGLSIPQWPEESYQNTMQSWLPSTEKVTTEITNMQGDWLAQMDSRVGMSIFMQTFLFLTGVFWRATAMMLLGMALFKLGVLSVKKSTGFYLRMIFIGLGFGYLIVGYGIFKNFAEGWSMEYSMFFGNQFNYMGSVSVALGYIGLVMLVCRATCCTMFKDLMAAVGKMAFTNYILMSVLALFIFYGSGFGLFGQVDRWAQILIVFGIWIIMLVISPLWLKYFYYGPLEWLWRVLTYWRYQPFKKSTVT